MPIGTALLFLVRERGQPKLSLGDIGRGQLLTHRLQDGKPPERVTVVAALGRLGCRSQAPSHCDEMPLGVAVRLLYGSSGRRPPCLGAGALLRPLLDAHEVLR